MLCIPVAFVLPLRPAAPKNPKPYVWCDSGTLCLPRCCLLIPFTRPSQVKAEKPKWHLAVIAGAVLRTLGHVSVRSAEYLAFLQKGQLPPARITLTSFTEEVVLEGARS